MLGVHSLDELPYPNLTPSWRVTALNEQNGREQERRWRPGAFLCPALVVAQSGEPAGERAMETCTERECATVPGALLKF